MGILAFSKPLFAETQPGAVDLWKNAGFEVPLEPGPAPELNLRDFEGSLVDYSSAGRIVILHFWATFCSPCRAEMKELNELQKQFDRTQILVIAVSIDSHDGAVEAFLAREEIHETLIVRDRSSDLRESYAVDAIPMSYIIIDGKIRSRVKGPGNWKSEFWRTMLRIESAKAN